MGWLQSWSVRPSVRRCLWTTRLNLQVLENRCLPGFLGGFSLDVGIAPESVAVGDFSGDGISDLAVATYGTFSENNGGVSVLLGNGDGTFQPSRHYSAGTGPVSISIGDFNGDGIPDLAVANFNSNNVSVLLGNGDGTFRETNNYAASSFPLSVAVGDLRGDGIQDLIVANSHDDTVSVLLGNGDGTFQDPHNFSLPTLDIIGNSKTWLFQPPRSLLNSQVM